MPSAIDSYTNKYFDSDGDNTAQAVAARPGRIYNIEVSNPNATGVYLQLFDALAANVTVGTTIPSLSFFIPPSGAMDKNYSIPIQFGIGITYACTTTSTGNGDPATGLIVNMLYR